MDATPGQALYLLHRSKIIHLVRHTQGIHNVEGEKDYNAYLSYDLFDAHLTPLGWTQVDNLHKHVQACGLYKKIDLVITSPLLRCYYYFKGFRVSFSAFVVLPCLELLLTCMPLIRIVTDACFTVYYLLRAINLSLSNVILEPFSNNHFGPCKQQLGVFGGRAYTDGVNAPPLMVANAGNSDFSAITSLNCPTFIAVELCRERLGVHPCDKRRSISEYRPLFPAIDFSLKMKKDILWKPDVRETNEEVAARGLKFLNWLWTREEKEIAVITHSRFLYRTLSRFGDDCHPTVKSEICTHFANCELRSMVIIDRSLMGTGTSTTNYPGKIPKGLDLPSDVADEKHPEKGAQK